MKITFDMDLRSWSTPYLEYSKSLWDDGHGIMISALCFYVIIDFGRKKGERR